MGEFEVTASGGVGAIEYSLDGVNFQTSNEFDQLAGGNYTVTLRDGNNCEVSAPITAVPQQDGPSIMSITPSEPSCGASDGSISIAINGGTGAIEYSIDGINYQANNTFTNIASSNIRYLSRCQ